MVPKRALVATGVPLRDTAQPVFTYPSVLRRLNAERNIREHDRRRVDLSTAEAIALLQQYCNDMHLGVQYDVLISEPWNHECPNSLTTRNLGAARLIRAQGLSDAAFDSIAGVAIPGLPDIPHDADLFESERYDEAVAVALTFVDSVPGIAAANASKLLHQKRPGMIPILDLFARRALDLPFIDGGVEAYVALIRRYRSILDVAGNRQALDQIINLLGASGLAPLSGKTRVRIVDVLAWGLIRFRDPFLASSTT